MRHHAGWSRLACETDPATRAYIDRRMAEGKTNREIHRCLQRYSRRQILRTVAAAHRSAQACHRDGANSMFPTHDGINYRSSSARAAAPGPPTVDTAVGRHRVDVRRALLQLRISTTEIPPPMAMASALNTYMRK
ncbi:MAG: Transposase [Mycobacterium sp.]|nr:Transposase [Mycobacterium sp.]